jgi:O-antigen ligase/polysaccharide polymerase Wzy-like membrane protein
LSTERLGALTRVALLVLIVGLALHNAVMAQLWELGVRGEALDVVAAWKEVLLLAAFVVATVAAVRRLPGITAVDGLAAIYTAAVLLYALIPQGWLDGDATAKGELLAIRHHLLPVAGYVLGRLTAAWWADRSRVGAALALAAAGVAVIGLVDLALISLSAWRDSGVPGWYREQLALDYEGLSGLPENWVFNTGDEDNPIRRLVSTFLSPLASAYAFVVGLVFVVSRRPFRWWWGLVGLILYAGLLYTHTRSAIAALAFALILLAVVQRRIAPAVVAVASVAIAGAFLAAYPTVGPSTHYTQEELEFLRQNAAEDPGGGPSSDPFSPAESSTASHWRHLRDGVEAVVRHPQGYGLGNAGTVAKRTGVEIKAGESSYTELGIDVGLLGALAFVLWNGALLLALLRREAWVGAAFAAVLLLGLQTDVIGVHWLAVGIWAAAGIAASPRPADTVQP